MQRMVRRALWLREAGLVVYANASRSTRPAAMRSRSTRSQLDAGRAESVFISLDESHAQNFELHDVLKIGARLARRPDADGADDGRLLADQSSAMRCGRRRMKVLEGVIDADHLFCVLYELDEGDDWKDEATSG